MPFVQLLGRVRRREYVLHREELGVQRGEVQVGQELATNQIPGTYDISKQLINNVSLV